MGTPLGIKSEVEIPPPSNRLTASGRCALKTMYASKAPRRVKGTPSRSFWMTDGSTYFSNMTPDIADTSKEALALPMLERRSSVCWGVVGCRRGRAAASRVRNASMRGAGGGGGPAAESRGIRNDRASSSCDAGWRDILRTGKDTYSRTTKQ